MGWLTKTLKSRRVMIAIGFILLIVLILVIGALRTGESLNPLLTFTERILFVVLMVFMWILFFMYERMQEVRRAGSLEQSIQRQADDQRRGVRPEKRADIEQFQKELTVAIAALKKSRLGKGRRSGNAALYALPWYLMIGPPGGGKTTAIRNSGLEFPTGIDRNKELRGVGGTRNCEWFFSTSAILLDTAGRYVSEDDDREEWLAFLDMLKKHRRKKPINGVLVGFSIQDLLNADEDEINEHAQKIRQRIDELMQRLGFRFPVYLAFTKCDLLDGFVEFFGDLNRREREQIWGTTFTPEQIEQMKGSDPRAIFAQEFQILLDALTDLRMPRLHSPSPLKREQRRKVFLLPLQVAAVKDKMVNFVGKLFQDNPYQKDNPIFRGFYLTSGTQEGVPLDRAIEAISREFGLPPLPAEGDGVELEIKNYFIKDLFTEVVIPDQNFLLGETSRAAEAKKLARLGIMVGAALALILFILGVYFDYSDSQKKMGAMAKAAQVVQSVNWPGDWGRNFNLLELLRKRMENYDEGGPVLRFAMSRRSTMLEAARGLYFRKMKDFVEKYLSSELQRRLQGYVPNAGTSQEQAYNYLKAYLLMSDQVAKLNENAADSDFLRGELMALLAGRFAAGDSSANGSAADLQALAGQQIQFFVENLSEKGIPAFKSEAALVNRVRDLLIAPVTALSVYNKGIKSQGVAKMPGVFSVAGAIGNGYAGLFNKDKAVSNLFTRDGWDKFAKAAIEKESQNPGQKDWVLGDKERLLSAEVKNPELLAKKLTEFYFNDYIRVWWEFLRSLQYENFPDIRTASDRLKTLSEPGTSPLKVLLEKASNEVSFDEGFKELARSGTKKIGIELSRHPVDRAFIGLHAFISGDNSPLTGALGFLAGASGELKDLAEDPTKAKDYAARVVQSGAGELPTALKEISKILGRQPDAPSQQVLANLFETPLKAAWGTVLGGAYGYLNAQWRTQVYEPYAQTLEKNYPFNRRGPDAGLDDVAAFFAPDGTFWKFAQAELQPFFRPTNYSAPLTWDGRGIGLSGAAQEAFLRAKMITTALAQSGSVQVKFAVQMKRPSDNKIDEIQLTIGGHDETVDVKKNLQSKDFEWPGVRQPTSGASLKLLNRRGPLGRDVLAEQNVEGLWGWFKLLEQWNPSRRSNSEYECVWKIKNRSNNKEYEIRCSLFSRGTANPFASGFFNFRCPEQLN